MYASPLIIGFTVYTKNNCPYCIKVKELLTRENQPFTIIPADTFLNKEEEKEKFLHFISLKANKKHRTFPIVFCNGKFIGGYTETAKFFDMQRAFSDF
jgi:glutaredoxin